MRSSFLGRHLHSQIVVPLVAAAVVVGIVATIVAVYLLSGLTQKWVDASADDAVDHMAARLEDVGREMRRSAKLAAESAELKRRVASGDRSAISSMLALLNSSLRADNLMILDDQGRVYSVSGNLGVAVGDEVLGPEQRGWVELVSGFPVYLDVGGRQTLTVLQPISVGGNVHALALSTEIDDALVAGVSLSASKATTSTPTSSKVSFCVYGPDFKRIACGLQMSADTEELMRAVEEPAPEVAAALRQAAAVGEGRGRLSLDVGNYRVLARKYALAGDPTGGYRFIVGIVSTRLSEDAGIYSRNLILMWSVVAVLALIGLGAWVANRVSRPLVALARGAQRIADGDFTTKVQVRGSNEISELADSFNAMTDSLRERSESLTKKVLELATLYEISRSLGSTLDMDTLLDSVLDSAMRIFNLDVGYIALRDRESGEIEVRARRGRIPGRIDDKAVRSSMAEWVIREGRPLIFNPPQNGASRHQVDPLTGVLASLCVPLTAGEEIIGSVTVGSSDPDYSFDSDDVRLLSTIANHVTIAIGNIELFTSLQEAYLATVRSLAAAVDAKDTYTRGHSDRVALYAVAIADKLGLSQEQKTALEMAAYLHDIGKIGIREEILLKPGRLTDQEMGEMRHHPLIGANILRPVAFPWSITPVVRHHHERWDGKGYPAGLRGEEIPLLARVLTVADSFEAMIASRPYRPGMNVDDAVVELKRCSGGQFDARIADSLIEVLDEMPTPDDVAVHLEDDMQSEEIRAIFSALSEGVFAGFRRLGGPRLADNLQREVNQFAEENDIPCRFVGGRMELNFPDGLPLTDELRAMTHVLTKLREFIQRISGHGLADHFYEEALTGLSERMRQLAGALDLTAKG